MNISGISSRNFFCSLALLISASCIYDCIFLSAAMLLVSSTFRTNIKHSPADTRCCGSDLQTLLFLTSFLCHLASAAFLLPSAKISPIHLHSLHSSVAFYHAAARPSSARLCAVSLNSAADGGGKPQCEEQAGETAPSVWWMRDSLSRLVSSLYTLLPSFPCSSLPLDMFIPPECFSTLLAVMPECHFSDEVRLGTHLTRVWVKR